MRTNSVGEKVPNSDASKGQLAMETTTDLPAVLPTDAAPPRPCPSCPERTDFLEGDAPAAEKVEAFLAQAFAATGSVPARPRRPGTLDLRRAPVQPFGQGLRPRSHGLPAAHAGPGSRSRWRSPPTMSSSTSGPSWKPAGPRPRWPRRLSVLRGTYKQLAAKGLVPWETAQDIAAVKAPGVQKNSTPSLTQKQAIRAPGGDPHRHLAGDPRPGPDECLLHHRLPGLGGDRGLRGAP